MSNRRDFLRGVGTAGAGLVALGYGLNGLAQPARREISIGGQRVRTGDIHAHCVIPEVAELLGSTAFADIGFPDWQALGPDRLDVMNERGVDYEALSINRYWWYAADEELANRIVRLHDEALAAWVEFEDQGLVRVDKQRLVITEQGRLVSRALVMPFDRYTQNEAINRFSRII